MPLFSVYLQVYSIKLLLIRELMLMNFVTLIKKRQSYTFDQPTRFWLSECSLVDSLNTTLL